MEKKDNLGEEIKIIMEEETFGMTMSQTDLDNILKNRKKTLIEKISHFLNMGIEIPLTPVIVGFVALFVFVSIPRDVFKSQNERIIDIGGSQVILRESVEVSKK